MHLALSSAAGPDLPLAALLEGCERRGLGAVELVRGHAHGVDAASAGEALREMQRAGVRPGAVAPPGLETPTEADLRLGRRLGAPVLVRAGERSAAELARLAARHAEHGVRTLLLHGTDPAAAAALRGVVEALPAGAAGVAWEVDPAADDAALLPAVLAAAGPALAYVRLRGGGPESAQQTGLGIGALMARLALSRYGGPLVLAPSTSRFHYAWRAWLGRAGGWGCGSKQSDPSLVTLAPQPQDPTT